MSISAKAIRRRHELNDRQSKDVTSTEKLEYEDWLNGMLNLKQNITLTGLSGPTLRAKAADTTDSFPAGIKFGTARNAPRRWRRRDVLAWIDEQEALSLARHSA